MSEDLIKTARRLARATASRPKQADLKRAISTAYYAAFHALAQQGADLYIGTGPLRGTSAWTLVYRSLDHGTARNGCLQVPSAGLSTTIQTFASVFVQMQLERHRADYDPNARYLRSEVHKMIADTEEAIAELKRASRQERRSFAATVLFRKR